MMKGTLEAIRTVVLEEKATDNDVHVYLNLWEISLWTISIKGTSKASRK
jgi:hypothetical protein